MVSKKKKKATSPKRKSKRQSQRKKQDLNGDSVTQSTDPGKNDPGEAGAISSLFVDEIPRLQVQNESPIKKNLRPRRKSERAAERRRARIGQEQEFEGPSTKTSLPQRQSPQPEPKRKEEKKEENSAVIASLTCIEGPETGAVLDLRDGSYTIGRGRDNNLILKDLAASRTHVRINVRNGECEVRDLRSGNGTRVNKRTIQKVILQDGDLLEVGNSILLYKDLDKIVEKREGAKGKGAGKKGAQENQKRIEVAAEKLAAELAERFNQEQENFGEISDPAHIANIVFPEKENINHSLVNDSEMAQAIDDMINKVSDQEGPSLNNETEQDIWADSETETHQGRLASVNPPKHQEELGGGGHPTLSLVAEEHERRVSSEGRSASQRRIVRPIIFAGLFAATGVVAAAYVAEEHILRFFDSRSVEAGVTSGTGGTERSTEQPDVKNPGQTGEEQPTSPSKGKADPQKSVQKKDAISTKPSVASDAPKEQEKTVSEGTSTADKSTAPSQQSKNMNSSQGEKVNSGSLATQERPPSQEAPQERSSAKSPSKSVAEKKTQVKKKKARSTSKASKRKTKPSKRKPVKKSSRKKTRSTAPSAPAGMSDQKAQQEMRKAVNFLKNDEYDRACKILARVSSQAASESLWKAKAQNLLTRRCQ